MRIDRILRVEANVDTDHTQTRAENLAANVVIEGSITGKGDVETFEFGIHAITQVEIDRLEAKRQAAQEAHNEAVAQWQSLEDRRLEAIAAHEAAVAAWQEAYDAGKAKIKDRPQMVPWPAQPEPVYREPVANSNVARVRAAVQAWMDEGNAVPAYVPPTDDELREAMPNITARQIRLGLLNIGVEEDQVAAIIANIPDENTRKYADIEWRMAAAFDRTHPIVLAVAQELNLPPAEVDSLWEYYQTV